jgi:hypothetical protein
MKRLNHRVLSVLICFGVCGAWNVDTRGSGNQSSTGVTLMFTPKEFLAEFQKVFVMSDGSLPATTDVVSRVGMVHYMETLMAGIGITSSVGGNEEMYMTVDAEDLMHIYMLATLGNLLNVPTTTAPVQTKGGLTMVVVDTYTGKLTIVPPYDTMRASFLETLLVLSIIAIVRLSMVRTLNR